ncbi:ethanolamine ammonia-lyase subunit EutC [Xanthomonas sp. WHRI 8391]|uniref:Ethanolamine ammonia-lyase small subunit n=1 Tax=Xanthomonas hortorum pv. carotae TaxID=487904 RepID=A0A6V7DDS2_9XANT|nr:ethanolamine ammonia-lyase subunit EutC [Xanthomonas hortorum]ETC87952.1 ethanolamine ammonia-lyase light chain [Xanthomonas hortorum pv. carotae str. M081]MBG3851674.1 ethanolamine ammonia-lyase subunit EutC [Xanthomonas hortorum pv. carotae]UTS72483.1 ethanolamine ammonia-lyase subunit EutC [Xanthomonas hortorum]CAD0332686.1 Ethanolamine ammonia-lyase light chain [Xanthomonas hortorum pv. carotae]CAD0332694.1 Ethanolamine ammonia-lyase light chain [Xanthomonas hortorum pv. carotae]
MSSPTTPPRDAWAQLRHLTPARIALGRVGTSLPTAAHLDFQLAHAQARDAVHLAFDPAPLQAELEQRGRTSMLLHSAAADRHVYLQRPDLGRRLAADAATQLRGLTAVHGGGHDVAVVVADGLSALAVHRNAPQMLEHIDRLAAHEGWSLAPVVLIAQGRVAIGDEVGELLKARAVIVLIGERPGLSSPDSLGLYLTYTPRLGLTDAARNCISNIRAEGLSYAEATHKLAYLLREAFRRKLSGVQLKDEAEQPALPSAGPPDAAPRTFLLPDGLPPDVVGS